MGSCHSVDSELASGIGGGYVVAVDCLMLDRDSSDVDYDELGPGLELERELAHD